MARSLNILFVGDVVGTPGLDLCATLIPNYLKKYSVDLLIVNGENVTEGKGLSEEHAKRIFEWGTHVITTGNHVWDRWDSRKVLGGDRRMLRPLNYARENGGNGYVIVDLGEKGKAGVLNLQGRVYMQPIDDPFRTAEWAVAKLKEDVNVIFVDFHADATAEKMAMGWHLDGRVTAVVIPALLLISTLTRGSGQVTVRQPLTTTISSTRKEIRGKVGGGGPQVRLRSSSGNVTVE